MKYKIEENIEKMPDIAIESCKSLVEGVCKTILRKLGVIFVESGKRADTPRDLLKKVLDNIPVSVAYEPEFVDKTCNLVIRMTEIRNNRGDISHGRKAPKEIISSPQLADFISQVTDGVVNYLLGIYFNTDLSYLEIVKYEDCDEFNRFLDEQYQLDGVVKFSQALYDQDFISYEEQLNNFQASQEE